MALDVEAGIVKVELIGEGVVVVVAVAAAALAIGVVVCEGLVLELPIPRSNPGKEQPATVMITASRMRILRINLNFLTASFPQIIFL